jgi:hypothetical protein
MKTRITMLARQLEAMMPGRKRGVDTRLTRIELIEQSGVYKVGLEVGRVSLEAETHGSAERSAALYALCEISLRSSRIATHRSRR